VQYREYGKTGLTVSALGYGAMRLPKEEDEAVACMVKGLELGINYIDTAYGYGDGWSERMVGRAARQFGRDKIYLATKNPLQDETADGWWQRMERSLKELDTDYIDFYKIVHSLGWESWEKFSKPGGPIEAMQKAKDQGLFKHVVFSCHDKPENLIRLIDLGFFEGFLVQYNLLDRQYEDAIAYAHEKGLGVEIMGPVGGGRLGSRSERLEGIVDSSSTAELALRFVLANPNVSIAFSGMSNLQQVLENCATASRDEALTAEEMQRIGQALEENKKLADLYCTGCNYCMPCPNKVGIPQIFSAMNMHRVWGLTDHARHIYRRLGPENRRGLMGADACVECGQCEPKCPQKIPIIEQLKESHEALGGQ
jgi:predicted aldo/keto reductase-like oxidoreductase